MPYRWLVGSAWPRKMGLNWFMPALANSRVGSLWGTTGDDTTLVCPRSVKKDTNASRTRLAGHCHMGCTGLGPAHSTYKRGHRGVRDDRAGGGGAGAQGPCNHDRATGVRCSVQPTKTKTGEDEKKKQAGAQRASTVGQHTSNPEPRRGDTAPHPPLGHTQTTGPARGAHARAGGAPCPAPMMELPTSTPPVANSPHPPKKTPPYPHLPVDHPTALCRASSLPPRSHECSHSALLAQVQEGMRSDTPPHPRTVSSLVMVAKGRRNLLVLRKCAGIS